MIYSMRMGYGARVILVIRAFGILRRASVALVTAFATLRGLG